MKKTLALILALLMFTTVPVSARIDDLLTDKPEKETNSLEAILDGNQTLYADMAMILSTNSNSPNFLELSEKADICYNLAKNEKYKEAQQIFTECITWLVYKEKLFNEYRDESLLKLSEYSSLINKVYRFYYNVLFSCSVDMLIELSDYVNNYQVSEHSSKTKDADGNYKSKNLDLYQYTKVLKQMFDNTLLAYSPIISNQTKDIEQMSQDIIKQFKKIEKGEFDYISFYENNLGTYIDDYDFNDIPAIVVLPQEKSTTSYLPIGNSNTSTNSNGTGKSSSTSNKVPSTVYWLVHGTVYHKSYNCPTLDRSTGIQSGPLSKCPKSRCCKVCG